MESFDNAESNDDELKMMNKLFNFFDENGDGKLSRVEAKVGFERVEMWEDGQSL